METCWSIKNFIATLEWDSSSHSLQVARWQFARLESDLQIKLGHVQDRRPDFARFVEQLSYNECVAAIRVPQIAGMLRGECHLSENDFQYYFVEAITRKASSEPSPSDIGLEIDYDWETPIPVPDRGGTSLTTHLPLEMEGSRLKIETANDAIRLREPNAHFLIEKFVWRLAVRKELDAPKAYSSGTFQGSPGLVLICNSHLERMRSLELEEALVHEAIHCYLFCAESAHRRLLSDPALYTRRVASPWSGALIGVHSAIHAIAVWYGLYHYFHRARHTAASTEERNFFNDRLSYIARGFISEELDEFVKEIEKLTSSDGDDLVSTCVKRYREAHHGCY